MATKVNKGLLIQKVLTWCMKGGLLGCVTVRKAGQATHCGYQRTLNTGHTLPAHGQLSCMEWSVNSVAMHFHAIWIKLTCRVPCATCPPGLLHVFVQPAKYSCPSGWHSEYNGYLFSDAEDGARWGKKDTVCGDLNAQAVPEALPAPTLLQL